MTSVFIDNNADGVWGVAPRQVAGTPVPVFSPFPGERGKGDRDVEFAVCLKNRFSLQIEATSTLLKYLLNLEIHPPLCYT